MRPLLAMVRAHPRRSALAVGCLGLATVAEGVGVSTLLPVLSLAAGSGGAASAAPPGGLEATLARLVESVGLEVKLGPLLALFVASIGVKAILVLLANRQVGLAVARVATDLRHELTEALIRAEWGFHVRHPLGASASAFGSEADRAAQTYHRGILCIAAGMQVLLYLGLALWIAPRATLAAVLAGGLVLALLTGLIRAARRAGKRQIFLIRESLVRLAEMLFALKPLKAMGREQQVGQVLESEIRDLNRAVRREVLSKEALKGFQEPLLAVVMAGAIYGAHRFWAYALPTLLALLLLFYRTLATANRMQREFQAMAARETAYLSLRGTIDAARAQREHNPGRAVPTLARGIELREVALVYDGQSVLDDASLSIPAGQITALVGMSGAGKTSIADLVLGLVRPTRGEVWIDDRPLSDIDLRAWRDRVGYVPQDISLFRESVANNIGLDDPAVSRSQIERALRRARADQFVAALENGLDTELGERGTGLSGGQRQRIAVARALVRDPLLLVLDEATTALDPESEAAICESVAALRGDVTVLVISHQSALVELADHVFRVEGGRAKAL